jgi:hypothetical protein
MLMLSDLMVLISIGNTQPTNIVTKMYQMLNYQLGPSEDPDQLDAQKPLILYMTHKLTPMLLSIVMILTKNVNILTEFTILSLWSY